MEALVVCSNCRRQLRVPPTLINNWVKCPECQFTFVAESAETDPTVASAAETAGDTWAQKKEAVMRGLLPAPRQPGGRGPLLSLDPDPRPRKSGVTLPMPLALGVGVLAFAAAFAGGYLLVRGGFNFGDGGGWRELESKEGMFRVHLPGRAKEQRQKVPSPVGNISVVMHLLDGDPAYAIGFADYPAMVLQANPDRLMDGALQGAIAGMQAVPGAENARKIDERQISYKGFVGREFEVDLPGKGRALARAYLVKQRIYILFVGGRHIRRGAEEADKFFDSFALTAIPDKPAEPAKAGFPRAQFPINPIINQKPGAPGFKKSGGSLK